MDDLLDDTAEAPRFPPDFIWGVATSAFQIEGGANADGKGPSIWDRFCRQPGAIADGTTGDVACDHYHRLEQDLDLIASLGVNAYRFSVSWPRVQPLGQGAWNEAGLTFYERLVDGLAARGIQAHLTLNHWDLPQALQDQGGWGARDTVQHFVDYALGIEQRLRGRVASICTHNEPWVLAVLGHQQGVFAPGLQDQRLALQVAHHLLLSHGLAVKALRAQGATAPLGLVLNLAPMHAASPAVEDHAKTVLEDGLMLRWYLDPLHHGRYPADVWKSLGDRVPQVHEGDMALIRQPLDFLGVNYYSRSVQSAAGHADPAAAGKEVSLMGWEVYPQGLTELLLRVHRDYPGPDLWITENGGAFPEEWIDGRVTDTQRIAYLERHIAAAAAARVEGVPVKAYMVWSLMDNFEWNFGHSRRFGIVHVDFETQKRTLKDSARWYRDFIAQHRPEN